MSILDGIGAVLSKITNHIQNREERRRNEIDSLEEERRKLLAGPCTSKSADRVRYIDDRLRTLYHQGANAA